MIHRLLVGSALALTVLAERNALACRTTTCASSHAPPECQRDPITNCWIGGAPLVWQEACVSFAVQERGIPALGLDYSATEMLVTQAFATWPNSGCPNGFPSISVTSFGPLACNDLEFQRSGPNANAVLFRDSGWEHDPTAIGLTTVTFDTTTGRIMDADVEVNLSGFLLSAEDLGYVLAHEAGHFFGLDHSADGSALMYLNYSPLGQAGPPVLTADDIASICDAYPLYRPMTACDFEPEHGFSADCGGDVEGGCSIVPPGDPKAPWLLVAVFGCLALRRRA
jgi:hypothetical protein